MTWPHENPFEVLKLAVEEEHFWHDQFEKRTTYYTAILSAIVAAIFLVPAVLRA